MNPPRAIPAPWDKFQHELRSLLRVVESQERWVAGLAVAPVLLVPISFPLTCCKHPARR